jgi:coproporphyrinogen III oxidase
MNFRYLEHGDKRWFGGGADLTPYYFHREDKEHFHGVWKRVCEEFPDVGDYPLWKEACDRYFLLPHRGERRGVGGIFFDYLFVEDERRRARVAEFVARAGRAFLDAYVPIAKRRIGTPVTEGERRWQEIRRGRYVEFNLLYDRGTTFGLRTGGRTESILMSLPPRVRWGYAETPAPGTPEAALLRELQVNG